MHQQQIYKKILNKKKGYPLQTTLNLLLKNTKYDYGLIGINIKNFTNKQTFFIFFKITLYL